MSAIKIRKLELEGFLASISPIMKETPEAWSRSVCLTPCHATRYVNTFVNTGECRVYFEIKSHGLDPLPDSSLVIEFKTLKSLCSASDSEFLTFFQESDGKFYMSLLGGKILVQNYKRLVPKIATEKSYFSIKDDLLSAFNGNDFSEFLKSSLRVFSFCGDSRYKRLAIKNKSALFNFLYTAAIFEGLNFPDMVIRQSDIAFLLKMCTGKDLVKMASVGNFLIFDSGAIKFSIPRTKGSDIEIVEKVFPRIPTLLEVEVDYEKFSKIANLIKGSVRGSGVASFYIKSRALFLKVDSKTGGKMDFPLTESHLSEQDSFSARCSLEFLNKVATTVSSECKRTKTDKFKIGHDSRGSVHVVINKAHVVAGHLQ
jgi:hypothetical protein